MKRIKSRFRDKKSNLRPLGGIVFMTYGCLVAAKPKPYTFGFFTKINVLPSFILEGLVA